MLQDFILTWLFCSNPIHFRIKHLISSTHAILKCWLTSRIQTERKSDSALNSNHTYVKFITQTARTVNGNSDLTEIGAPWTKSRQICCIWQCNRSTFNYTSCTFAHILCLTCHHIIKRICRKWGGSLQRLCSLYFRHILSWLTGSNDVIYTFNVWLWSLHTDSVCMSFCLMKLRRPLWVGVRHHHA